MWDDFKHALNSLNFLKDILNMIKYLLNLFFQSYYALIIRGNLRSGEKVLIQAGTGGVGMSAISIALSMGCEVFTTVSSLEKKRFLLETFPVLVDENIGE